jgi:hypothetical protein
LQLDESPALPDTTSGWFWEQTGSVSATPALTSSFIEVSAPTDLNLRHWFRGTEVTIIGRRRGYAAARSLPAAGLQTLFVRRISRRLADENR